MTKNLLITNIARLVTMVPGKDREGPLGVIADAAVLCEGDRIAWVGPQSEVPEGDHRRFDTGRAIVLPGLIDCHTHLVHGGSRQKEFKQRSEGMSYQQIAADGGGILSTVRATRSAPREELERSAFARLDEVLARGVTTLEIKTGYGLDAETEAKMIDVIVRLSEAHAISVLGTFLGAHVVPVEYQENRAGYIRMLIEQMIPAATITDVMAGCDIFVEEGAFTVDEARQIAEAAHRENLALHLHVDQFGDGGGARLAAELGAANASHLDYTGEAGMRAMQESGVVPVLLPGASFFTGGGHYPDARRMCEMPLPIAIATDYNPGTTPSLDLMLNASIAVTQMKMTCDEALRAITCHAAQALGLSDRGAIDVGLRADFACFDAPDEYYPLYRYGMNTCSGVVIGGRKVR